MPECIIKRLNASMLTTAVFELVQQFYHATGVGDVANAVCACSDLISHGRQKKDNCFG